MNVVSLGLLFLLLICVSLGAYLLQDCEFQEGTGIALSCFPHHCVSNTLQVEGDHAILSDEMLSAGHYGKS